MPAKTDYLSTYMQDHRAGAEMGRNLAARLRDENAGTPYEDFLTPVSYTHLTLPTICSV